jgi:PAS domain S-box-containing protein
MSEKYKILHLEDVTSDAELVAYELKRNKINFEQLVIDQEVDFINALDNFVPDIILCDHSLPAFNSLEALRIVKEKKLFIPFILITATMSEEIAMQVIKEGADDYILKDRLKRLPSAVLNAVQKYRYERERSLLMHVVQEKEADSKKQLDQLSNKLLLATRSAGIGIWHYIINQQKFIADELLVKIYGLSVAAEEFSYEQWITFIHPEDKERVIADFNAAIVEKTGLKKEFRIIWEDGSVHYILATVFVESDAAGNPTLIIGTNQDITEAKLAEIKIKESEEKYRTFFRKQFRWNYSNDT